MRTLTLALVLALLAACGPDKTPDATPVGQRDAIGDAGGANTAVGANTAQPTPVAAEPKPGALASTPPADESPAAGQVLKAQQALNIQPDKPDLWAALGLAWIKKARADQDERLYAQADDASARALSLSPNHRQALVVKAMVLQQQHRFKGVREIARLVTAAEPRDTTAWGLLGDAALELGDYEAAEDAYQHMIDLLPDIASYSRVAWLRWIHGDVDGAAEMWDLALKITTTADPEPRAFCLSEMGHLEWHRGRLDDALRFYDAALTAMPQHAPALFGRGRVHLAKGLHAEAVADLEASFKARRLEETWTWLAHALRANGQAARADQIEARLADASDADDPRSVSLFLSTHKLNPARALALARKDAEDRGDLYTHDALAFAALRAGLLDDAARSSALAMATNPPDPRLIARAGLIDAARGQRDQARARLQAALDLNPAFDPTLAAEARAALEALGPDKAPPIADGGQP